MEELTIYQRQYDLILYAFPIINGFPKGQRFVLGQQIQNCLLDIAKLIVQANKQRTNRLPILAQADIEIEKLRLLIRLAKDLRMVSVKQYGTLAERINEIGRLLGGWLKSQTAGSR
jgi:four helix bundle protein